MITPAVAADGVRSEVQGKSGGAAELECFPPSDSAVESSASLHVVEWVRRGLDIPVLIKFGTYALRVHPNYEGNHQSLKHHLINEMSVIIWRNMLYCCPTYSISFLCMYQDNCLFLTSAFFYMTSDIIHLMCDLHSCLLSFSLFLQFITVNLCTYLGHNLITQCKE